MRRAVLRHPSLAIEGRSRRRFTERTAPVQTMVDAMTDALELGGLKELAARLPPEHPFQIVVRSLPMRMSAVEYGALASSLWGLAERA